MYDVSLFQRALGLDERWEVVGVEFDAAQRRLDLRIDFRRSARFRPYGGPAAAMSKWSALPAQAAG